MIIDEEQKLLETLINVFDDLESILIHKNHQHIIFAFLQLKKLLRKAPESSKMSIDRIFVPPASQKKYSKIKRCTSGDQGTKSLGKQSNASFDIIKGAEFFNQSHKTKPYYQKQYSEVTRSQRPYMENQRQEPTRFTGPYKTSSKKVQHPRSNLARVVPRIVGLVSEEEISDIQRKSRRSFNYRGTQRSNVLGMDYRSIVEVEDDDDEFEDVVLNRLDMIEEKVNQMLKDKRKLKPQSGNANIPTQRPPDYYPANYPTRSRLQAVNSGPNIIHPQPLRVQRSSEGYQYQQPTYNYLSQQMAPGTNMLYTFKNTNTNSYIVPNNRMSGSFGNKGQFTERARKLSQRILSQLPVYSNENQHYPEGYQQPYRPSGGFVRETQPQVYREQNIRKNNQRSGRSYIDSTGTLRYSIQESQRQRPSYYRDQQTNQKQWDSSRSRQEVFIDGDHVYKYIPMAKYVPDKTQRHFITRRVGRSGQAETCDEGQYRVGKVVFIDKVGQEIIRRDRNEDNSSSKGLGFKDDFYNKSGKSISVIQRPLGNSKVKAYTDQGDFISRPDEFSMISDKGIRSEIRQIRETIKHYGSSKVEKKEGYKTRNVKKDMVQKDVPTNDYRYRQETQKKQLTSRKPSNQNGDNYEEEAFIQRLPSQEKVVNVVRSARECQQYVQKRVSSRNSDVQGEGKEQRYETFSPIDHEAVYRSRTSNSSSIESQPANFERGDTHVYERKQSNHIAQRKPRENQFKTIIRKDDDQSQKKVSIESVHTFKSIPFHRLKQRKNTLEKQLEELNHYEKISQQQSYYQDEDEDKEHQEQI